MGYINLKKKGLFYLVLLISSFVVTELKNIRDLKEEGKLSLADMGIQVPEILFPKVLDIKTWSVVSCDQYTQDKEYWKEVEKIVGDKPSTLKITYPEVYLHEPDRKERIENIKKEMVRYINDGVFSEQQKELIYLERFTRYGRMRKGLIMAIDLETYDWQPFTTKNIRATEATIIDRLPPRIEIRKRAAVETPHIMMLVDDPEDLIINALGARVRSSKPLYDGELMQDSGSVRGWAVKEDGDIEFFRASVEKIFKLKTDRKGHTFLFAVGDGNHSLATAKAIWDDHKKRYPTHTQSRLRYALVELVNIYDEGLTFEPIHRVIFNVEVNHMISFFTTKFKGKILKMRSFEEMKEKVENSNADFGFMYTINGKTEYILLKTNIKGLGVSTFQPSMDEYFSLLKKGGLTPEVDFIHGTEEVERLGKIEKVTTILLPPIDKNIFFETINKNGPLPRKSFSMGEADEKRFYLECRKLN